MMLEELHAALVRAGMTDQQAGLVSLAVSNLIVAAVREHVDSEHAKKPKAGKPSKKPQARRRWKKR